MFSIPLMPRK